MTAGAEKPSSYGMHPPTGTEKLFGYGRLLDMALFVVARGYSQPRWFPVVALTEKSRGCGGGDSEWWQSLCHGFDGFEGVFHGHVA